MAANFFAGDTAHGYVKRAIYQDVLKNYLSNHFDPDTNEKQLLIIDGFAGEGLYGNQWSANITKHGSPIIALMEVLNYFHRRQNNEDFPWPNQRNANRPNNFNANFPVLDEDGNWDRDDYKISLIFNESKMRNVKALCLNIVTVLNRFFQDHEGNNTFETYEIQERQRGYRPRGPCCIKITDENYPIHIHVIRGDFEDLDVNELQTMGQIPPNAHWISLLDPYGYSDTPMDAVTNYIGHNKSMILNLMSSFIHRFKTAHPGVIEQLYGNAEFQNIRNRNHTWTNVRKYTTLYMERLREEADTRYTCNFEARIRNKQILYHIVMATKKSDIVRLMKGAMCRWSQEEDIFACAVVVKNITNLNPVQEGRYQQDNNRLADLIYVQFSGRVVSVSEIERYVLAEVNTHEFTREFQAAVFDIMRRDGRIYRLTNRNGQLPHNLVEIQKDWQVYFSDDPDNPIEIGLAQFQNILGLAEIAIEE